MRTRRHTRLLTTDLEQLPEGVGERLGRDAWDHLIVPVAAALRIEADAGRVALDAGRAETVAGALLASLQALPWGRRRPGIRRSRVPLAVNLAFNLAWIVTFDW